MADLLLLGTTGYTFGWPSHGNNRREPTNDAKISTQKGGQVTLINNIDEGIFTKRKENTRDTLEWPEFLPTFRNGQPFFLKKTKQKKHIFICKQAATRQYGGRERKRKFGMEERHAKNDWPLQ